MLIYMHVIAHAHDLRFVFYIYYTLALNNLSSEMRRTDVSWENIRQGSTHRSTAFQVHVYIILFKPAQDILCWTPRNQRESS